MSMHFSRALVVGWMALASGLAAAETQGQISGFVSLGHLHTSENRYFGSSEDGLEWREAGITASAQFTPRLRGAAQLIYRKAGDLDGRRTFVDFALLEFALLQEERTQATIQAGRVKVPLGLFNETRDVPQTRLGVLPPLSVYFEPLRELVSSSDGVRVDLGQSIGETRVQLSLAGGRRSNETSELELLAIGTDAPGPFRDVSLYAAQLTMSAFDERLRLGVSHVDGEVGYSAAGPMDPFSGAEIHGLITVWSAEWQSANWYAIGESSRQRAKLPGFPPPFPSVTPPSESHFVQLGWRPQRALEVFGRREVFYANVDDRRGTLVFEPNFGVAHLAFSKSWVLGSRFDLNADWTLRAEHHWVDGTAFLPRSQIRDFTGLKRDWNLLALSLSYRF